MNGTTISHGDNEKEGEDILYQKDASFSAELAVALGSNASELSDPSSTPGPEVTTQSPNLEQKVPPGSSLPKATQSLSTVTPEAPCVRDCGLGGSCALDDVTPGTQFCECPLGRGGDYCEKGKLFIFVISNVIKCFGVKYFDTALHNITRFHILAIITTYVIHFIWKIRLTYQFTNYYLTV